MPEPVELNEQSERRDGGALMLALDTRTAGRYRAAQTEAAARNGQVTTNDGVAVIPVQGFLSNTVMQTYFGTFTGRTRIVRDQVSRAAADGNVSKIVLHIDSPGGSVDGITETAAVIRAAAAVKPVIAVADTLAASAAFWLATQANEFVATPSAEVGSLGVFMHHESWAKYEAELGVEHTFISAGQFKTEGNMFEPLSAEAQAHFQESVEEVMGMFIADVAKGRKASVSRVRGEAYGQGRLMSAKAALANGVIDRIATIEQVMGMGGKPGRKRHTAEASSELLAVPVVDFRFET